MPHPARLGRVTGRPRPGHGATVRRPPCRRRAAGRRRRQARAGWAARPQAIASYPAGDECTLAVTGQLAGARRPKHGLQSDVGPSCGPSVNNSDLNSCILLQESGAMSACSSCFFIMLTVSFSCTLSEAFVTPGMIKCTQSGSLVSRKIGVLPTTQKPRSRIIVVSQTGGGDDLMKKFEEERKIREEMDVIFKNAQSDLQSIAKLELDSLKSEAEEIKQRREEEWAIL